MCICEIRGGEGVLLLLWEAAMQANTALQHLQLQVQNKFQAQDPKHTTITLKKRSIKLELN